MNFTKPISEISNSLLLPRLYYLREKFRIDSIAPLIPKNFTGTKLAYIFDGKILVYLRDNFTHIPFPGMWDFPGGGREGDETAEECVLRELQEEFGIVMDATRLIYKQQVTNHTNTGIAFFFVTEGRREEIDRIVFGSEGQYWQLMEIQEFFDHPLASPVLKPRLLAYLNQKN